MTKTQVIHRFRECYGEEPAFLVRAPGRVNLIGEHTDYNDGFVLPIAIDRAIWIALRARSDQKVEAYSLDYEEAIVFDLNNLKHKEAGWGEYVKGVAWALQKEGHQLAGWEGVIGGDVPRGAGLSSSAAVELAVARAFATTSDLAWNPTAMARLGQRVENEWIGVHCGIMDQMVVASACEGMALLIDCRTLATQSVPLPEQTTVAVLDTGTRRGLVGSAYNERRARCEQAARFFGMPALRDVDFAIFEENAAALDDVTRRRARHVIAENARTLDAVEALHDGDATRFGALMNASHASLRDDFEVSSRELDIMADIAQAHRACYGARMTGAGFGGCGVALIETQQAAAFAKHVAERYQAQTDRVPHIYLCTPGAGVQLIMMHRLSKP